MIANIGLETFKYFNKAIDIFTESSNQIKNLNAEFLRFCAEEEKKQKEKNKPPKIYFEKECPYPDPADQPKKANQTKTAQNPKNNSKNDAGGVPAKKPPQYLNYQKDDGTAAKAPPKPPVQRPANPSPPANNAANDAEQKHQMQKKVSKTPPKEDSAPASSVNNDSKKDSGLTPMRPKAPISAFIRFNKAHINDVRKEYPHMAQTDLVTVTGHMWSTLPPEIKKKFDDEYARDKERYDAELAEFYRKNPNEKKSKKQIQKEKQASINARRK